MSKPDYEKLYQEAMQHLKCVSGSRNSFTLEASRRLFDEPAVQELRTPGVEKMHWEAVEFLRLQRQLGYISDY